MRKITIIFLAAFGMSGCVPGTTATPKAYAEEASVVSQSSGPCPQVRKTPSAPASVLKMKNPNSTPAGIAEGRELFHKTAKPFTCATCHGKNGDGMGDPDFASTPPARDFTCKATMESLEDGQLFWVIKNGSPKTAMLAFGNSLSDDAIWALVAYLRTLSR